MKIPAIGSRAQVFHGNAVHTAGGLYQKDLFRGKDGSIKSRKASAMAKRHNNLGSFKLAKGSRRFVPGGRRH